VAIRIIGAYDSEEVAQKYHKPPLMPSIFTKMSMDKWCGWTEIPS
jgi:hypothetical protein